MWLDDDKVLHFTYLSIIYGSLKWVKLDHAADPSGWEKTSLII